MVMTDLFPRGVAQGKAFYNRITERKKLKQNIAHTTHTVLIAPRRYGKTSLITQVLYENKINHIWIDFMTITSRDDVEAKLLQKISNLVVSVVPATKRLKQLATKYFSALNPEITLKLPGVSLKLHPGQQNMEGIAEGLISLDNLAKDINKHLVVVLDEFQEILRIDKDSTLQGSIRHAVERSKQVTYLFSGSKHRPLRRMFSGKENPLYALCEPMELSKISDEAYISFINKAAIEKWETPLNTKILYQILSYSDRYPKYVNALCGAIWTYDIKPTSKLVNELWYSYVLSRKTDVTEDLSDLTLNQRRLLQWLCFEPTAELYSKETLAALKMSQSSVQKAIEVLLEKNFVIEEENVYRVLDPIFFSYFKMFS